MTDIQGYPDLNNLLKKYEDKKIILILKDGYKYETSNLSVIGDNAIFTDKFGSEILIDISQVARVVEVKEHG